MTHGSLFSGIGGFDLASEWMGWENVFHCEWNDFGKRLLKYYWPKAISYDDITKTDFTIWRGKIDILTGGFPCQPYSTAGKRKGKEDERHLWPEMLRAIREIKPKWIVGENVSGIVSWNGGLVFNEVQADLETEGYEVQPVLLPAAGVNAPHQRERVWFIAYSNFSRDSQQREDIKNKRETGNFKKQGEWRQYSEQHNELFGLQRNVAYTNNQRQQECNNARKPESQRWFNRNFLPSKNWEGFPTESPVLFGDDGFSSQLDGITFPKWRNESIKGGGNAIVPQVALQIFKAIYKYDTRYFFNQ